MKYLKFMAYNSVKNASRNRRELEAAYEYGFETYCYSSDRVAPENVSKEKFKLYCDETPIISYEVKPKAWRLFLLLINCFRHASKVRHMNMDVISCHNIKTLAIAYWAYLLTPKQKKPYFIYDSHEFEIKRKKRNTISLACVKALEGFLIKKCAFTIIVCDDPADELKRMYKLKNRPIVVRSTPNYWEIDTRQIKEQRELFCKQLNIPTNSFITVYSGYLTATRGLEEILEAMEIDKDIYSIWIGDELMNDYEHQLIEDAINRGVINRLLRHPAVPQNELWRYIGAGDASIVVMDYTKNDNYMTALPNKFFEAIQSLVPLICADSIEMSRIVKQYNIGLLIPASNGQALADAIKRLRDDKELYNTFKNNLKIAKENLCWEKEKYILIEAFDYYFGKENKIPNVKAEKQ